MAFAAVAAGCSEGDARTDDPGVNPQDPGKSLSANDSPKLTIATPDYTIGCVPDDPVPVTFEVDVAWTAAVEYAAEGADWLAITPEAGPAGRNTLLLAAADNPDTVRRKAFVAIAYGDEVQRLSVVQEAAELRDNSAGPEPKLELHTPDYYEDFGGFESYEEKISFTVNTDWKVEIKGKNDWLTVTPASGTAGTVELTMTLPENPSPDTRRALIDIAYGSYRTQPIWVYQRGQNLAYVFEPEFAQELVRRGYIRDAYRIARDEVKEIKSLQLHGGWDASQEKYRGKLTSLKGIEYFESLESLTCWGNRLTALDVSKNKALEELMCYSNRIESLDVSGCPALRTLYCRENRLTTLDVGRNAALADLSCGSNLLSTIDIGLNVRLLHFSCENNPLVTPLDLSRNVCLKSVDCSATGLTSLDISGNRNVTYIVVFNNPGDGERFPVYAWFDNETIPEDIEKPEERPVRMRFPTKSWIYAGRTIAPDYRKVR